MESLHPAWRTPVPVSIPRERPERCVAQDSTYEGFDWFGWLRMLCNGGQDAVTIATGTALMLHAQKDGGNAHPGERLLARMINRSEATAGRRLALLEAAGLIQKTVAAATARERKWANAYRLTVPDQGSSVTSDHPRPEVISTQPEVTHDLPTTCSTTTSVKDGLAAGLPTGPRSKPREPERPSRAKIISDTREAVSLVYGDRENVITEDEQVLDVWGYYVGINYAGIPHPVAYLAKIFRDAKEIDWLLERAVGSEEAADGLDAVGLGVFGETG